MSKEVKGMMIEDMRRKIGDCRELVVINTSRLDALTDNRFRTALRKKGISLMQVKNNLARHVLESAGVGQMESVLQGPSTLVWGGEDIVALSKEITQWTKDLKNLEIKGAAVDGQVVDAKGVDELSKSPGRLELISIIAGQILSPGGQLAALLLGPGGTLAGQLKTLSETDEEEPEGEAAGAATEPSATEPSATEPSATEPSATEPSATEPSATEPAAAE